MSLAFITLPKPKEKYWFGELHLTVKLLKDIVKFLKSPFDYYSDQKNFSIITLYTYLTGYHAHSLHN